MEVFPFLSVYYSFNVNGFVVSTRTITRKKTNRKGLFKQYILNGSWFYLLVFSSRGERNFSIRLSYLQKNPRIRSTTVGQRDTVGFITVLTSKETPTQTKHIIHEFSFLNSRTMVVNLGPGKEVITTLVPV